MPVAMPAWRKVLLMPEAMPLRAARRRRRRSWRAGGWRGRPPMPPTMKPASRAVQSTLGWPRMSSRPMPDKREAGAEEQRAPGSRSRAPATGATRNETSETGRKRRAGLERRVAEHVLQVQDEVEEHREHRRRERKRRDLRAGERGLAEQGEVEHRLARSPLDHTNAHQDAAPPRAGRRSARSPSPRRCRGSARTRGRKGRR